MSAVTEADNEDQAAELLAAHNIIDGLSLRIAQLEQAITRLHAAKGRYHTQMAVCDLLDLMSLKNERPVK